MVSLVERDRYWVLFPPEQRLRPSGRTMQQARLLDETWHLNPGSNLMTGFPIILEIGLGVIDVVLKELTERAFSSETVTGRS